jgi:hypothetical protein
MTKIKTLITGLVAASLVVSGIPAQAENYQHPDKTRRYIGVGLAAVGLALLTDSGGNQTYARPYQERRIYEPHRPCLIQRQEWNPYYGRFIVRRLEVPC